MLAAVRVIGVRRAVDQVADQLRAELLSGRWSAGDRLPPERSLAEELGVNRLTLRAAISRLESEGLVRPRQGDGLVVLDYRRTADLALLRWLVVPLEHGLVAAFLELRRAVAAEAVALAASRAKAADLAALAALAEAQEREQDPAAFARRDLEFARTLLRAARNLPMELLLNSVEEVYLAQPALVEALHGDRAAVRASYRALTALVEAGDEEAARRLTRRALEAIDEAALGRLGGKKKRRPR